MLALFLFRFSPLVKGALTERPIYLRVKVIAGPFGSEVFVDDGGIQAVVWNSVVLPICVLQVGAGHGRGPFGDERLEFSSQSHDIPIGSRGGVLNRHTPRLVELEGVIRGCKAV